MSLASRLCFACNGVVLQHFKQFFVLNWRSSQFTPPPPPPPHRSLDDGRLLSLGVFDGNHRRSIVHKAQAATEADLDSMLTDLTSVIADLEAFTVVSLVTCCPEHRFVRTSALCKHVLVVWAVFLRAAK